MIIAPLNGVDLFYIGILVLIAICWLMSTVRKIAASRADARARIAEAQAREAEAKAGITPIVEEANA